MTDTKKKIDFDQVDQPIPMDTNPGEYLQYADGVLVPAEHYSDYVQSEADKIAAMSAEQLYAESIKDGLPRDPRVEERLNMVEVEALLNA